MPEPVEIVFALWKRILYLILKNEMTCKVNLLLLIYAIDKYSRTVPNRFENNTPWDSSDRCNAANQTNSLFNIMCDKATWNLSAGGENSEFHFW